MSKFDPPHAEGFQHEGTKRVAVLAKRYADSSLNGDVPAYFFNRNSDHNGLDPWQLVEGVDKHTQGESMDIWFANGHCITVGPLMTIFLAEQHAKQLGVNP